jgi:hypothetical protein
MADVMDDEAPEGQLDRLYEQINACPDLIFQLLTKRPHRYADRLPISGFVHRNVRLGATCEDQHFYDVRWPILHRIASAQGLISWISYEPALGPLTIKRHDTAPNWIIFGGETGSEAQRRPMEQSWAEKLMDECAGTGTRFFMKQMSATNPRLAAELIPAHLLIRDFPGDDGLVGLRTPVHRREQHIHQGVRLNAISYWRADVKLNLQRYSVLDSELFDTRWNSSAIRDTGFTVGNCTRNRFLSPLELEHISKQKPTFRSRSGNF